MSEGIPYGDIIVIAAIAAFIILRYRSILGEKSGFDVTQKPKIEQKDAKPKQKPERVVTLHPAAKPELKDKPIVEKKDEAFEALEDDLKGDLEKIKKADSSFRVDEFVKGAGMAFEMVLDAFNKGDEATLKMLLAKPLYEEFKGVIDARDEEAGVTLVSIKRAEIVEAKLKNSVAQITVEFISEQIIAPSKQIEEVEDEWVFERDTRSKNPNWTIIDT